MSIYVYILRICIKIGERKKIVIFEGEEGEDIFSCLGWVLRVNFNEIEYYIYFISVYNYNIVFIVCRFFFLNILEYN